MLRFGRTALAKTKRRTRILPPSSPGTPSSSVRDDLSPTPFREEPCYVRFSGVHDIYIYIYAYMHICIYTYIHIYIYTYIHIYIYTYIHIYIYTYMHICIYAHMHMHMHIHIHIHIHMHIHIHIHTYIWCRVAASRWNASGRRTMRHAAKAVCLRRTSPRGERTTNEHETTLFDVYPAFTMCC